VHGHPTPSRRFVDGFLACYELAIACGRTGSSALPATYAETKSELTTIDPGIGHQEFAAGARICGRDGQGRGHAMARKTVKNKPGAAKAKVSAAPKRGKDQPQATKLQTGNEFLESLRDGRAVYIYGERVKDVTTHPAFRNTARMIARLYDALHDPKHKDKLLLPTDTGNGA
jgi:hypothetical protein